MSHVTATGIAGMALASLLAVATQAAAQQPTPADRPAQVQQGSMDRNVVRSEDRRATPRGRVARQGHIVGWTTGPQPVYSGPDWAGWISGAYNTPYNGYNAYYNGGPNPVGAVIGGVTDATTQGLFGGPSYSDPYYNNNSYNYPPPGSTNPQPAGW
jgi:hypothetical protein